MKKKRTALGVKAAVLVFVLGCSICFFGCSTERRKKKRRDIGKKSEASGRRISRNL